MKSYFEYEFNDEIRERMLKYYDSLEGMDDFDNGDKKTALKLNRIEKYIPYNPNDIICDIGCADAVLLRYLQGKYKEAIGLDISPQVIEKDKQLGIDNVVFKTYDGAHIETDRQFDKVFLMDVLEHAFEPDILIQQIHKILKTGGMFIIQVPATGWLSEAIFGRYHYGHLRYYDEEYLKSYLEGNGFKVVHVETFNSVPWSQKLINLPIFPILKSTCSIVPHSLWPYFGSVAAIAQKV